MTTELVSTGARIQAALRVVRLNSFRSRLLELRGEAGVTPGSSLAQYAALDVIDCVGPAPLALLAAETGLERSTMSRHAGQLERAGLVQRHPDPSDHRATVVLLSPAGRRELAGLNRQAARLIDERLAGWPPGEADALAGLLERLIEELRAR